MPDLTPQQLSLLKRLQECGFAIVAFPLYANYVGIRRGNCGALLAPVTPGLFQIFKDPAYLISGNLTVPIMRSGKEWYVWKKETLEATEARRSELKQFASELSSLLESGLKSQAPHSRG